MFVCHRWKIVRNEYHGSSSRDTITRVETESQKSRESPVQSLTELVPLEMLRPGESGVIAEVDGDPHLVHRLHELGLHADRAIAMVRPGSPCLIQLGDQRLSLRLDDAATVLVSINRSP